MNRFLPSPVKSRILSSRLGSVLLLFQRSPIVQMLFPEARIVSGAGLGEITAWTVATIAGLGAYDSVAGATTLKQLLPNANSTTVPTAVGAKLSFVFQITGTESAPKSWQIIGSLPGGLSHTNSTGSTTDSITGVPNETGNFPITIKAWEGSGNKGNVYSNSFTISVAGAVIPPSILSQPFSVSAVMGTKAKLRVKAQGGTLNYQWYKGSSGNTIKPVKGANSSKFITPPLKAKVKYWVRVSNQSGAVNSKTIVVSIK